MIRVQNNVKYGIRRFGRLLNRVKEEFSCAWFALALWWNVRDLSLKMSWKAWRMVRKMGIFKEPREVHPDDVESFRKMGLM